MYGNSDPILMLVAIVVMCSSLFVLITEILYSIITPFLSDLGGGLQLRYTSVELYTVAARSVGELEGTTKQYIFQHKLNAMFIMNIYIYNIYIYIY